MEERLWVVVLLFEVFIALFDLGGGFRLKALKEGEEFLGIERLHGIIGVVAFRMVGSANDDDRDLGLQLFEGGYQFVACMSTMPASVTTPSRAGNL
jgi:hypothetical protein